MTISNSGTVTSGTSSMKTQGCELHGAKTLLSGGNKWETTRDMKAGSNDSQTGAEDALSLLMTNL